MSLNSAPKKVPAVALPAWTGEGGLDLSVANTGKEVTSSAAAATTTTVSAAADKTPVTTAPTTVTPAATPVTPPAPPPPAAPPVSPAVTPPSTPPVETPVVPPPATAAPTTTTPVAPPAAPPAVPPKNNTPAPKNPKFQTLKTQAAPFAKGPNQVEPSYSETVRATFGNGALDLEAEDIFKRNAAVSTAGPSAIPMMDWQAFMQMGAQQALPQAKQPAAKAAAIPAANIGPPPAPQAILPAPAKRTVKGTVEDDRIPTAEAASSTGVGKEVALPPENMQAAQNQARSPDNGLLQEIQLLREDVDGLKAAMSDLTGITGKLNR